jgi:hypothetical protein
LIDEHVDGGVGRSGQRRGDVVRNERVAGAISKQRQVQHQAVLGQPLDPGEQIRHGEIGEVLDGNAAFERLELLARGRLQMLVER